MKALPNLALGLPDKETRNPVYTRMLLDMIGKPDSKQYNILVTGSKGKGSVSRILSSILQAHGYKVGLFTSPHLISYKERIRINGRAISDQELIKYANSIKAYIDDIQDTLASDHYIGPVGITLVMALLYFLDNKTHYNVVECGKGARYDDVNMIFSKASIINTVFEEHIPQLGNSLLEIAHNKAGIVKASQDFVFSAYQNSQVLDIIKNEANMNKVILYHYDRDYKSHNLKLSSSGTQFDVITKNNKYENLNLRLLGRNQAYNAALAISAAENIIDELDADVLDKCFEKLTWPGRLEIISNKPTILLDGCINKECAQYVREVIEEIGKKDIVFIIGIPDDKDYLGVIKSLGHLGSRIILTKTKNQHLKFKDNQYAIIREVIGYDVDFAVNIDYAMEKAKSLVTPDDMICILGTQSLVKETKELFNQDTLNID